MSKITHWVSIFSVACVIAACSSEKKSDEVNASIQNREFGTMPDGTVVEEYTLTNANGLEMKVITYGGIITSLKTPDRDGNLGDIVLGYDDLEGYIENNPYFGAIIGRYGNRIARGKFTLDSVEYSLATNNIGNHLHGGIKGFDKVLWQAEPIQEDSAVSLKMTYKSKDMEEGYPGNLDVTVIYKVANDNTLTFDYYAATDKKTIVNLTNHCYYNLTGVRDDILSHELYINASQYIPVDSTLIPTSVDPVEGTPFDFSTPKKIGTDIEVEHAQLKNGGGYDHAWVLNGSTDKMNFAASLYEASTGRFMEIYTTEPAIQFYSGNFLDGSITGKEGTVYQFRTGLCLETEHYPDSPNHPDYPGTVLNPGEEYRTTTITKFSTK